MAHIQAIFIFLYVVFFFGVLLLMVLNYGSAENYNLLKPIAGGMFVSLFFIVSYLFAPLEVAEETTPIVMLSRQDIASKQESYVSFPHLSMYDDPGYGYHGCFASNQRDRC